MRMRSSVRSAVPSSGGLVARLTAERETGGFVAGMCASKRLKTVRLKLFLRYARSPATHRSSDRSDDIQLRGHFSSFPGGDEAPFSATTRSSGLSIAKLGQPLRTPVILSF